VVKNNGLISTAYPGAPELPPYMAAPPPWEYPPPSKNTKHDGHAISAN